MFWTVNGEKIDKQGMGGKYSKVSVDDPSLTIYNVNKYDAGSYKLTATNAVGTTISDAIEISIYNNIIHWIIKKKNLYKKTRCLTTIMLYHAKHI